MLATSHGKLYGLDSANGDIIWSRVFGLGWAGEPSSGKPPVGGTIIPLKSFTIRGVGDVNGSKDGDKAEVVVVAQRKANNVSVHTLISSRHPFLFSLLTTIPGSCGYRCVPC